MPSEQIDLHGFSDGLAAAVDASGSAGFMPALDDALRRLVTFDNSMVFAYPRGLRPFGAYTDIDIPAEAHIVVDQYILGPYLLDPYFEEVRRGRRDGLAYLQDIAPDSFFETEYYERHYRRTRITDEAGFFVAPHGGTTLVHSVTRRHGAPRFTPAEVARLRDVAPLICALGRAHWAQIDLGQGGASEDRGTEPPSDPVESALAALGQRTLSARQTQIVGHVLKGHSTEAIGLILGISAETVKVHRRNAYARLGISSQAELFSLFIDLLSRMVAPGGGPDGRASEAPRG